MEGALLAAAVAFALVFVASFAYSVYALLFGWSKGFEEYPAMTAPTFYLVPVSLFISLAAAVWLSRLVLKHQRRERHTGGAA